MATSAKEKLLNHTASLISRKWTLRIAGNLQGDTKRYSQLIRELSGVTQKVLTETLREMERIGLVERYVYPTVPPKVEYKLTIAGQGLLKLSDEFSSWFEVYSDKIYRAKRSYDSRKTNLSL